MKEDTRIRNDLLVADYKSGYTMKILQRKYDISYNTIYKILTENGVEMHNNSKRLKASQIENIVSLYEQGMPTTKIAENLKLSKSSVEKYIREYKRAIGLDVGTQKFKGKKYNKSKETSQLYINEYAKGASVIEIAKKYGVSRQRIYQAINDSKEGKEEWEKIKTK